MSFGQSRAASCSRESLRPRLMAAWAVLCALALVWPRPAQGQQELRDKVRQLNDAMNRVQQQIEDSQQQLKALQSQLAALQRETEGAEALPVPDAEHGAAQLAAAVDELRERQTMAESQIATEEQTKVESESKYPLKLSGMILMNGFVNTGKVDSAPNPAVALEGPGSTGASVRQTVLGLDARGPRLFGARSHADIRFDFDGAITSGSTYGADVFGLARLRTAHADLSWEHAQAFFSLDRPVLSPLAPDSLTAVGVPALAWSGNLWSWSPQFGAGYEAMPRPSVGVGIKAALIDVADPPALFNSSPSTAYTPPSTAEQSRWPGVEAEFEILDPHNGEGAQVGVGGLFASHRASTLGTFKSWAGTLSFRLPMKRGMQISGSGYRGQALGGLGGGGYKDYVYSPSEGAESLRVPDDAGGWGQWKQRFNQRFEFNGAFGIDNLSAHQLRPYAVATAGSLYNLARNRTFTANAIYSPSAYVLLSLEFRHILSSFVNSPTQTSDVIGIAAGYKF